MTVTGDPAPLPAPSDDVPDRLEPEAGTGALDAICPYLVAGDGTWQSAHPIRNQRCGAVDPPALLARDKQRDLCLVSAHRGCATYLAARASGPPAGPYPREDDANLWPVTRSKVLVVETERRLPGLTGSPIRAGGQLALVALMVVAFVVLLVARTSPTGSGGPGASLDAGASPSAIAIATPSARPTPAPSASPSVSPTPKPTASPKPTPKPTAKAGTRRYRIKSGDTLGAIALRFGTTLKVLKRLNGISDPRLIHPGQVIVLP